MFQKRCRPKETIAKLREAEVLRGQGNKVPEVVQAIGISELSYYRWRDEYGELFYTIEEARILTERLRREYNHRRPYRSLGGRPPAPETRPWPGLSLRDSAPPAFTEEAALAL